MVPKKSLLKTLWLPWIPVWSVYDILPLHRTHLSFHHTTHIFFFFLILSEVCVFCICCVFKCSVLVHKKDGVTYVEKKLSEHYLESLMVNMLLTLWWPLCHFLLMLPWMSQYPDKAYTFIFPSWRIGKESYGQNAWSCHSDQICMTFLACIPVIKHANSIFSEGVYDILWSLYFYSVSCIYYFHS